MKVDMPLNKETKPNLTKPTQLHFFLITIYQIFVLCTADT